jgi:hypothetical protein
MAATAAKMPSDRIAATADLTFQFICTFHKIGTGRSAKRISVRRATLELKKAANLRFDGGIHVPSTEASQVKARGRHWKKTVTALVSFVTSRPLRVTYKSFRWLKGR